MIQKLETEQRVINLIIAILLGLLMNPILIALVFVVDSPTSNEWLHGKPLLERTPFAYTYFWSSVFLPGNPPNLKAAFLLAVISNTILYASLIYILLNYLVSRRKAKKYF